MDAINPSRLELARRRRGKTKGDLAAEVRVSPRMLSDYLRGEKSPSERTLQHLSAALEFPVAFFYGSDVEEPLLDGVSFRSLSTMTARQRDQATGAAAIALRFDDWLRERFELPVPDLQRLRSVDPESAAETVREAWGLGQRRAPDMVHLLEAHGVRVFSLAQECAEVDAFSFWRGEIPYIFLNTQKTGERSRMDAAHELGHLVMHAHGGPEGRIAEREAQGFAAAFLMPRRSVLADAPRGATVPQILKAKRRWNVAAMNLAYRMRALGLLTEWQARSAYIELTRRGYRDGEPGGIERETSQILPKVFATLREEGITRGEIARSLALPLSELGRLAFGLSLAAADGTGSETPPLSGPPPAERPALHVVM
jgi:Zn-dependent peptidase ImmA (M78 family)